MRTAGSLLLLLFVIAPVFPQAVSPQTAGTQAPASPQTQGTQAPAPAGQPGAAQGGSQTATGKPDLSIPKDTDATWTVGFSVFSADGLSPENTYLAYSLPLLLKDAASGLTVHTLSDEERNLVGRAVIAREVAAADAAITSARKDQSALAFSDTVVTDASRAAALARVTAAQARRNFLAALDPATVIVADSKPIAEKEGTGAGKLLDQPMIPPDAYCARQGIEILVGGSIREVQGYLLLDVWAFDATRGKMVLTWRNAAQRDELYASVSSLGKELTTALLGRPWSLVVFAPEPKGAALFVDGSLVVAGASPALYLSPGSHAVRIAAQGYEDVQHDLTFNEGEETRITDVLQKVSGTTSAVSTDPVGADLYIDSVWKGKTPLVIDVPAARSRGVLALDGYYDRSFSLAPDSPPVLSFSLEMDIGSKDVLQKKARDDFYASFGWFALSLPIPLFSLAFENDYAAYDPVPAWIYTGTYYAGIAISVALFSVMVSRIIHYVIVSNGTAG